MDTNEATAPDHLHIHDRARTLVEGMRKAEDARAVSQRRAADFISEQMDRIADLEGDVGTLRQEKDGLEGRIAAMAKAGADAAEAHRREVEELRAAHSTHVESLVAGAANDIDRLKSWVRDYQAEQAAKQEEMASKQADLERDNARLALEGERLSEENAALAQTAEALASAIEEHVAALHRQDVVIDEAVRRQPRRPAREGSVVRMQPRPRADQPENADGARVEAAVA